MGSDWKKIYILYKTKDTWCTTIWS